MTKEQVIEAANTAKEAAKILNVDEERNSEIFSIVVNAMSTDLYSQGYTDGANLSAIANTATAARAEGE